MRMFILAALSMTMLSGDTSSADKEKALPNVGKLMQEKLKNSQILLEGLAVNDFDKITSSAEELIRISKAAEWLALKTPQYGVHMENFRRTAETIIKKAKEKNLDGATLGYVDMTVTCIRCHQHTREATNTSIHSRLDQ